MTAEGPRVSESLVALGALEGLQPEVGVLVFLAVVLVLERLVTMLAPETTLLGVAVIAREVALQFDGALERLAAVWADEARR